MNFKEFHNAMLSFVVFSYEDINGVFGHIDRRRLFEWSQKEYIIPVIRGYYVFSEFKETEDLGLLISNRIYEPSYLSLEYILSMESIIPEAVYTFTAISTRKTSAFNTSFGNYSYRNIKNELFLGYDLRKIKINLPGRVLERFVKVAKPEKAFFDFVYLKKKPLNDKEIIEYRFDGSMIKKMNQEQLFSYVSLSKKKTVELNIKKILKLHDIY